MDQNTLDKLNQFNILLAPQNPEVASALTEAGLRFSEGDIINTESFTTKDSIRMCKFVHDRLKAEENMLCDVVSTYNIVSPILVTTHKSFLVGDTYMAGYPEDIPDVLRKVQNQSYSVFVHAHIIEGATKLKIYDQAEVFINPMTEDHIQKYMMSCAPFDYNTPFGMYGILDSLIYKITGDYFTLRGMPLPMLYKGLKRIVDKPFTPTPGPSGLSLH